MTDLSRASAGWPLRYGLNPHQGDASLEFADGAEWLRVLNGAPGYVNGLDALKAWQLARELRQALDRPAATSIKHVHPAGAAVPGPMDEAFRRAHHLPDDDWSPLATAYARAAPVTASRPSATSSGSASRWTRPAVQRGPTVADRGRAR